MSQHNHETNTLNPEITQQPAVLSFDYESFKADLEKRLELYRTVVTADTVKEAKETATELNKLKTNLDTRRKQAIAYVSAPIKEADSQMKDCIQLVADGRKDILDQVAKFDQARLAGLQDELTQRRDRLRAGASIQPEFYGAASDLSDLVKLGNLTPKDRLTAKATQAVAERVNSELKLQQTVERRLLELENASYRAGLAAPLTKAHVEHFLYADDETYTAKLDELLQAEVERDRKSREAIARDAERQAQVKPEPEPEPAPEPAAADTQPVEQTTQPAHGEYQPQPQTEAKPQGAQAGKSEQFHMTVTMTATLPAGLTEAEIERQFRAFIEKGGNTKVDFMTVMRDSEEAQDVA